MTTRARAADSATKVTFVACWLMFSPCACSGTSDTDRQPQTPTHNASAPTPEATAPLGATDTAEQQNPGSSRDSSPSAAIAPSAPPIESSPTPDAQATDGQPDGSATVNDIVDAMVDQQPDGVSPTSRARRIAPSDFDRVLSDLLRMDITVANTFPEEIATLDGYFEDGALVVNDRLRTELARTAEELSQRIHDDPAAIERLAGCADATEACRDSFIDTFVSRAYRRPLEDAERTRFSDLFESAADLVGSGNAFADGVQLVIEAVLQSPKFLYRIEVGSDTSDDLGVLLTDHEIASRLSFLILGTMPDDELFAAANAGMLHTDEQVTQQAERLLADPRLGTRVTDFHERFLQLEGLASASKDSAQFPGFGEELVASMRAEADTFTREVTLTEGAGIRRLLTAPYGFADARLAQIYDLGDGFGPDLARVDYGTDSARSGILTQAAFLSGHSSSSTSTSPILRGRFVLERILCFEVPDPPPNAASQEPPAPATPPVTTRDMFEWKTSMDTCMTCHSIINPAGFAFESFDAIGRYRSEEKGAPVDASGTSLFPQDFSFEDTKDFVSQVAQFPETRACYARNWLRFAYARSDTTADLRTLATLAQGFESDDFGARDVLLALTRSAAFTHILKTAE